MPLLRQSAMLMSAVSLIAITILVDRSHDRDLSQNRSQKLAKSAPVHAHFDSVLIELQSADAAGVPGDRRARRTALIGALRGYNARGDFPNNYDFPDAPTPYFVDRVTGVRCAVAHLLESTGRHDIVQRVVATNNNVRVADLAGDAAFVAWVEEQGITLAEASRIQPSYEGSRNSDGVSPVLIGAVIGGSALVIGTSIGTSVWNTSGNADGHSRAGNVFGVVSGALTTLVGASIAGSREDNGSRNAGIVTAAVGGVGMALGVRGISRRSRTMTARRDAERSGGVNREQVQASLIPLIGVGRNATTGVSMQIRF